MVTQTHHERGRGRGTYPVKEIPDHENHEKSRFIALNVMNAWCGRLSGYVDAQGYESAVHFAVAKAVTTYRPGRGSKWSSWLITIVKQALVQERVRQTGWDPVNQRFTRKVHLLFFEEVFPERSISPARVESIVVKRDLERRCRAALTRITPMQREAILRYFYQGQTYKEIGRHFRVTRQRAWGLVHEGLYHMRLILEEGEADDA